MRLVLRYRTRRISLVAVHRRNDRPDV